jgi:hypothetical protein
MNNLSPAAQAVMDAFHNAPVVGGPHVGDALGLAAALRAAADQMPTDYPASLEQMPEDARRWYHLGFGAAGNCDRSWLSAIAVELEGESCSL